MDYRLWRVVFTNAADRQLKELRRQDQLEVKAIVEDLTEGIPPQNTKRMRLYNNLPIAKFGSSMQNRIVFRLNLRNRKVIIDRLGPRNTIYRPFKQP